MNPAQLIGWTIIHSVWEIAAIALFFFVVNLGLRRATSNLRYGVALAMLVACLLAPVATLWSLAPKHSPQIPQANSTSFSGLSSAAKGVPLDSVTPTTLAPSNLVATPVVNRIGRKLDSILPTVVTCWLIGLAAMCLRLVGGLVVIERLKRAASNRLDDHWQVVTDGLAKRMGIRQPVSLRVSDQVSTPAVVGFLRSVILLPAAVVTRLSPEDVEALLAHELAHIRRYDTLVNLAQSLVETVLFYHPAAWWISSVVRTEREHCCDDVALTTLNDREQYARALMNLEILRPTVPSLAMGAGRGSLLARIRRIVLAPPRRMLPASTWTTLALAIAIPVALAGNLHAKHVPPPVLNKKPSKSAPVSGRVIDADGHPVNGATVLFQDADYSSRQTGPIGELLTDANGAFHLERGAQIVAMKTGVGFGMVDWDAPFKAVVRLLPIKQIHIRAETPSGSPIPGVTIGVTSLQTTRFEGIWLDSPLFDRLATKTDADGRAVIEDMPAKASVVLAVKDAHYVIRGNANVLRAPRDDREIKLVLEPAGGIEGSLTESGKPISRASIITFSEDKGHRDVAYPDANGHFRLLHQPVGRLLIQARTFHSFGTTHWSDPHCSVVISPDTVQHVDLKIGSGTPLTVQVRTPNGRPLEGLSVRVFGTDARTFPEAGGITDRNGTLACTVAPGLHWVTVEQWTRIVTKTVTVGSQGTTAVTVNAPIEEKDERIVCRLLDAAGKPLGATTVKVGCIDFNGKESILRYVTDQYGKAIVLLPASRVKSMWASAKSGDQVSAPRCRPEHGVITLQLHRIK